MANYFITIMILLSFNGEEMYKYVQHKEAYQTYSECTYYLNSPQMREYIQTSLRQHLCDNLISIVEYGCMTKDVYIEYSQ